ncbi:MAG: UpxY family transcription antiterminator [Saprospiraceae bacterium]|nr:UpxY family transcription antiterminator [Saprospiraceae bacterium]
MKTWKVLRIRSQHEFCVQKQLDHLCIEHFLPTLTEHRQWSDRIRKVLIPAFPNYLFVHTEPVQRETVFHCRGVMNYLRYENRDATLRDDEIQMMKTALPFSIQGGLVPWTSAGEIIRISSGMLKGYTAKLVRWKNRKVVCLELHELKQGFLVEMELGGGLKYF